MSVTTNTSIEDFTNTYVLLAKAVLEIKKIALEKDIRTAISLASKSTANKEAQVNTLFPLKSLFGEKKDIPEVSLESKEVNDLVIKLYNYNLKGLNAKYGGGPEDNGWLAEEYSKCGPLDISKEKEEFIDRLLCSFGRV